MQCTEEELVEGLGNKLRSATKVILAFCGMCVTWGTASPAHGALGDVLATYPFRVAQFLPDPTRPIMYATDMENNSLDLIDTHTLAVTDKIPLPGPTPPDNHGRAMTISADGNTLYIANYTNNSVDEIDTHSLSLIRSLPVNNPYTIAAGLDNRLYISQQGPSQRTIQIDATTGAAVGLPLQNVFLTSWLQMSPDQKTLYVAAASTTPTQVLKFDVTTTSPGLPYQGGSLSNNSTGLTLNHSGNILVAPGNLTGVGLLNAATLLPAGNLDVRPASPVGVAFSPNDKLVYVGVWPNPYAIDVFDSTTLARVGQFTTPYISGPKTVDQSGRELFASFSGGGVLDYHGTIVYSTGVPEPGSLVLAVSGACVLALLCRRAQVGQRP